MTATIRLSHMGHRLAKHCLEGRPASLWSPLEHAVVQLYEDTCRERRPGDEALAAAGLVETTELDAAAVRLRYRQNPLENVRRVVFEYTTACGMGCAHCRCARLAPVTESAPEALVDFAALVLPLGITRFDFIGGEVLRKAFYRPCPTLRVRADGELATCPLTDAGNGYGNIHHQSPRTLLNRLDASPIAQLHASGAIAAYRRLLPEGRVGGVDHLCTLRALLSSLARRLLDDGLLPLESAGDRDATDEAMDQLLDDERRSRAAAAHADAVLDEAGFSAL